MAVGKKVEATCTQTCLNGEGIRVPIRIYVHVMLTKKKLKNNVEYVGTISHLLTF